MKRISKRRDAQCLMFSRKLRGEFRIPETRLLIEA